MNKMGKKVRQMLTMLLATSLLTGSVPVNAFAAEGMGLIPETEVVSEMAESDIVEEVSEISLMSEDAYENISEIESISANDTEEEDAGDNEVMEETVSDEDVVEEIISENLVNCENQILSENEEVTVPAESISGNQTEISDEITVWETTEETVDITFTVSENTYASYVKIIQIDEESLETEVVGNKVSAVAGKPLKFKLELTEGYKVTMVKMGNTIIPAEEGIYTTYPAAAGTIEIQVAELEKYQVRFSYDEELVKELKVKRGREDVSLDENFAADILEDSIVSFTVTLDDMAKVVKVTANKEEIKAIDGTTYEMEALEGDVEVKIETSLDGNKCNTLDIVVWGLRDSVSIQNNDAIYGHNERLLSKNTNEEIRVVLNDNYVVNENVIYINNEETKFNDTATTYNIDFSKNKNQTIVIYTTPKKSVEKKKLVFANRAEHVTYEVIKHAINEPDRIIVEKDAGKNNTYTISENETIVEFKVTSKEGYEPTVTIPEGVSYDVTSKGNTDTYSLAITTLGNEQAPTEISIDEIPQIRTISVVYDTGRLNRLSAIVDGKYIQGEESFDGVKKLTTQKFRFAHGTEIILQMETKDGFTVGAIKESKEEETLKEVKPQKTEYSYTIKADKDKNVELQLDSIYVTRVYDVQEEYSFEIEAEKDVYSVETGRKYKVCLYNGVDLQAVLEAALKSGNKTLKDNVKIINSDVYVEIPETETGKNLTLEMSCKEGTKISIFIMKMKVLPETKITKITGIKKGKVSQTADTVKEYKFTSNLTQTDGKFGVEVVTAKAEEDIITEEHREQLNEKAKADFGAEIVEDEIIISVKTSKAGEQALIKLYDISKSTENKKYYISGGTILITSKAPAFTAAKPTVSLKNATNLNLILNLGMKNLEEIENGEIWYKVKATPLYTNKTEESIKENTSSFEQYIKCTGSSQTESVRAVGRGNETVSEGSLNYKADFEIEVSLIQTTDKNEPIVNGENSNVAFISKASVKKTMSTKAPSYETKLGLKKIQGTVYTGQKEVIVAEPVFSKNTSYQKITCVSKQEGITATVDKNNHILVSVAKEVKPGKYTIEVIADAAENTVAARKDFTIQVVQGIYEISLDTPKELYKAYKKKSTLKVGITYNDEEKDKQPKNKKVEWVLQDSEGKDIDKEHPYYEMFSIKNGVVTINKDFVVSGKSEENIFRVKAIAQDYEREEMEVAGYSDWILITNKKVTLGELVLVKETENGSGIYDVTARSNNKAYVDEVNGSKLVVLKKGTPERDWYTASDFMEDVEDLLVYSCNSKDITINDDKTVTTDNIAGGVSITAKVEDGSNVKTQLNNVDIIYAKAGDLGIVVKNAGNQMTIADSYAGGTAEFYGAKDEVLIVKIQEKVKGISGGVFGADHQLKVQGAKIVESRKLAGEYEIVGTSDTIVLELVNNTTNYNKTFTLKNVSLANKEVKNSTVLKLKTEGTLETGYFTKEQQIIYTLPKASIGKYTHAWVTIDRLDYLNEKKTPFYDDLLAASGGTIGEVQQLGSDGKVVISFKPANGEECYYIPEADFTYKLNISFGTMTENYEFKAAVKSNAVSLKTKDAKLVNAKIKTSYNLSAKEGGTAELALTNKKVTISGVGRLMNMNVKGIQNKFTQYFELGHIESGDKNSYVIKLKPGVDVSKISKNDLSGYISQYTYTNGNKEKTVYNTAIKVVLKDLVQKFSLSKAIVLSEDVIDTNVNLLAGKTVVCAEYAYVPEDQNFSVSMNDDGSLNLRSKEKAKIKSSNKCTVYVIPEQSYYTSVIDELWKEAEGSQEAETELIEAMKKYGIKLTASISVKDKAKTKGKIKFASKDLKPKFTEEHFIPAQTDSTKLNGTYTLEIPYTNVVDCEVVNINNQSDDSMVKIKKMPGADSVIITLDKEDLRDAYKANKKIYGKTLTVKAVAKFGEGTKDEVITFKVTLPKQPVQLKAAADSLNGIAWADLKVQYQGLNEEETVSANRLLIEEKVNEVLSKDCDLKVTITGTAQVPTKEAEGKIVYTIVLTDVGTEPQEQKKVIATIPLGRILTAPLELEESLQGAIQYWENRKITNLTTMSSILSSVRSKVKISEYKHLRLYTKDVETVASTASKAGSISGNFCIVNVADKQVEPLEIAFNFVIPKLMTLEEAAVAVKETVEQIVVYNNELGENKQKKMDSILETAKEVLEGQDYYVQIKQGATLEGTLAEGDVAGKASLKFEIVYLTTERLSKDITCEFQVLETEE